MRRPPRVFLPSPARPGQRIVLPSGVRHHLTHVLRLRPGARLSGAGPDGAEVVLELLPGAEVLVVGPAEGVCGGVRPIPGRAAAPPPDPGRAGPDPPPGAPAGARPARPALTLAVAPAAPSRMDWLIEKAVEVGVDAILPLHAERSVRPGYGAARAARWARLAEAAARQARRRTVPALLDAASLAQVLSAFGGPALVADPDGRGSIAAAVRAWPAGVARVLVAIGPEGGWSPAEQGAAEAAGAVLCPLGPHILRVETAALVAVVLVQAAWEATGGPAA